MCAENDGQVYTEQTQENRLESPVSGSENRLTSRALAGLGRVMYGLGSRLVERFEDKDTEHSQSP